MNKKNHNSIKKNVNELINLIFTAIVLTESIDYKDL